MLFKLNFNKIKESLDFFIEKCILNLLNKMSNLKNFMRMAKKRKLKPWASEDKALGKLRYVPKVEKVFENYLRQEAGWDGVYPIPFSMLPADAKEFDVLSGIEILHTSADDRCYWISDPQSAYRLYAEGYSICTDPAVLEKRKAFK